MIDSRRLPPGRALLAAVLAALFSGGLASAAEPEPAPVSRTAGVSPAPSIDGAWYNPPRAQAAAPARLSDLAFAADRLTVSERHALPGLSEEERRELSRAEKGRAKVGLLRRLGSIARIAGPAPVLSEDGRAPWGGGLLERGADGSLTWTTAFSSLGADAMRLHLTEGALPGARIYVYTKAGEVHGPYTFAAPIGPEGFWTNTLVGDEVFLEAQLPRGSSGKLTVATVAHLENLGSAGLAAASTASPASTDCLVDASCVEPGEFAALESVSHAVATLIFRSGTSFYACSGGLVATSDNSFVPYLLTAHHCFDDQSSASSLEAIFNYRNPSCGGNYPSMSSFPRTLGATLLATSGTSDFTLVRLAQAPPSGSYFLGWSAADHSRSGGTAIYRLSYPAPGAGIWPQYYSRHTIAAFPSPGTCAGYAQGNFIYSKDSRGGVAVGSSGAPVLLTDGRIVGQLLGACGSNVEDDCDSVNNSTVDGAFAVSFPQISQWLQPAGPGGPTNPGSCTPNAATLCLNQSRFRVSVVWRVASQGIGGSGTAVPLSGDTGYFWFFSSDNVELIVKALDGRGVNGHFWIFYGALSDVEYTITVTDTVTGAVKTYANPQGRMASQADTSAFR